jgi:RHS repeat-associated protein
MASMPHLQNMEWDFAERLSHITKGTTEAYYNYDGSGERVRKIVEKDGVVETRLYLGGFEIFRKKNGNALELERETLHIMDNFESNEPKESEKDKEAEGFENNTPRIMNTKRRVAIVETKTWENYVQTANPIPMQRYQLSNNIESATLELDETANIISYEEYYPYGDTSYQAGRSAIEVSQKHYRYTGKEKDEESGLYYHGARYYACWLGRWTASDPARLVDGTNLYMYCRGNSVGFKDPYGFKAQSSEYHGGRYTLFVSPQYLDFSQSLIGAIPVLGLPFSVLNMAGQRLLGGFRDIDYNVTETLGIALGTIEHINNSDILKTMSNWAGKTLDAVEIAKYPYDWYGTKNYQIEEAIYNHFDRYIWISDNRDFVDLKFNYAMQCITSMLATGSIEIRKAVDFFGESEFNNGETYQYDSLKGKYNSFNKDDYYFFATDGAASDNSISKLEEIIRLF